MASLWCHTAHKVGGAFRYPGGHRGVGDGAAGAQRMAALRLRFGNCFSYALAQQRAESLLFKGSDFAKTDVIQVCLIERCGPFFAC